MSPALLIWGIISTLPWRKDFWHFAAMNSPAEPHPADAEARWRFLRDVAVFQLKMLLDNVRDFALMPVSLIAAGVDLVFKTDRQGGLFYRVLRWGSHSEEVIDVYSSIKDETRDFRINPRYTVDGVIARLENVLVRECEKGGTAASIKSAMDRAFDQLHRETSGTSEFARKMLTRTTEKIKGPKGTEG
jgi:hypothetical protein